MVTDAGQRPVPEGAGKDKEQRLRAEADRRASERIAAAMTLKLHGQVARDSAYVPPAARAPTIRTAIRAARPSRSAE